MILLFDANNAIDYIGYRAISKSVGGEKVTYLFDQ